MVGSGPQLQSYWYLGYILRGRGGVDGVGVPFGGITAGGGLGGGAGGCVAGGGGAGAGSAMNGSGVAKGWVNGTGATTGGADAIDGGAVARVVIVVMVWVGV